MAQAAIASVCRAAGSSHRVAVRTELARGGLQRILFSATDVAGSVAAVCNPNPIRAPNLGCLSPQPAINGKAQRPLDGHPLTLTGAR